MQGLGSGVAVGVALTPQARRGSVPACDLAVRRLNAESLGRPTVLSHRALLRCAWVRSGQAITVHRAALLLGSRAMSSGAGEAEKKVKHEVRPRDLVLPVLCDLQTDRHLCGSATREHPQAFGWGGARVLEGQLQRAYVSATCRRERRCFCRFRAARTRTPSR